MTPAHVRRAVALYMESAWPRPGETVPIFDPAQLDEVSTLEQLFALCRKPEGDGSAPAHSRYTLRLGNDRYPRAAANVRRICAAAGIEIH